MQAIACENNLSETAFFVRGSEKYELRWFTPEYEIDLCGHATLATAFVIFEFFERASTTICFMTKSGELVVEKDRNPWTFPLGPARWLNVLRC